MKTYDYKDESRDVKGKVSINNIISSIKLDRKT
jgi:hypothetical protein